MEVLVETVGTGFAQILHPFNFLILVVGVLWGMVFGAVPGLTATMGVALAIPFTFAMKPISGLTLLTGIYIGGVSGGFISATLLNMPGTPSSVTTCFDAHPMSKQGKSGLALGLGLVSSFVGGILGVVCMIMLASVIARWALRFGPFEYFSLGVMAFVAVTSMLGGNVFKNLTGIALGLLLSTIGPDPITSVRRLTFGFHQLDGGLALLPVLVGLFCISEVILDIESEVELIVPKESRKMKFSEIIEAFKHVFKEIVNTIRSFVVGFIIGVFPGIGGATANIISYGLARSSSKQPQKFGTGIPSGIIASEVSNNASIGGAMVPLLALGIPGDAV
ncbi:MAG: tripartite tricarboxylate transporter permease, partial [Pseudothermotoga sp.]